MTASSSNHLIATSTNFRNNKKKRFIVIVGINGFTKHVFDIKIIDAVINRFFFCFGQRVNRSRSIIILKLQALLFTLTEYTYIQI